MIKISSIILFCLSLYSCATLFNDNQTEIEIHTIPQNSKICLDNDSCYNSPIILNVPRSKFDFNIIVKNDTIERRVLLKSRFAPQYSVGNLILHPGYVIDAKSLEKNYSYKGSMLINILRNKPNYPIWRRKKPGPLYFRFSSSIKNFYQFNNTQSLNQYYSYFGFYLGLDYYYSINSYLSLTGGMTGGMEDGFPRLMAGLDYGSYTSTTVMNIVLTNNYEISLSKNNSKKFAFSFGYGISYLKFDFNQLYNRVFDDYQKSTLGLGIDANLRYKPLFLGVSFLPSFYTISSQKWEFSYLGYINLGFRFSICKVKDNSIKVIKYEPKLLK